MNTVITREKLISDVARQEGIPLPVMQSLYKTLEKYIFESLSCATLAENVEIKVFNGLSIDCTYQKAKKMIHPETGQLFETEDRIWAKPKLTRYYNRKLNGYFDK